jgi:hypothetical protein
MNPDLDPSRQKGGEVDAMSSSNLDRPGSAAHEESSQMATNDEGLSLDEHSESS